MRMAFKQGACSKGSGSVPSIRRDVVDIGAEGCSSVQCGVERRSVRGWSAVDKATETEHEEDTENNDVPPEHCSRCDDNVDQSQVSIHCCCTDSVIY